MLIRVCLILGMLSTSCGSADREVIVQFNIDNQTRRVWQLEFSTEDRVELFDLKLQNYAGVKKYQKFQVKFLSRGMYAIEMYGCYQADNAELVDIDVILWQKDHLLPIVTTTLNEGAIRLNTRECKEFGDD